MSPKSLSPESLLTTYQIAELLQVHPGSVCKWTRDGKLRTFFTPGGHRRIRAADLAAFCTEHNMAIPAPLGEHLTDADRLA